jgi:hypothetical protein
MTLLQIVDVLVPFGRFIDENESKKLFSNWGILVFQVIPFTFFIYWLFRFIPYVGGLIYFLGLVPLSAYLHIKKSKHKNKKIVLETYLKYLVVVAIGFGGIWSFVGHTFMADSIANGIGWETGSPFQTELAFYTLGSGIAGILAIWYRFDFLLAVIITKAVFWYGAAFVHIQDAIVNDNYSKMNIGSPLIADIILPTVFLILIYKIYKIRQ